MLNRAKEKGIQLLEVSMVIPVIVVLIGSGFQFGKSIQTTQALSFLSREIGNTIYRPCVTEIDSATDLQNCYNREMDFNGDSTPGDVENYAGSVLSNFEYNLTWYEYDPILDQVDMKGRFTSSTFTHTSRYPNELDPIPFPMPRAAFDSKLPAPLTSLNADNTVILISEVFYEHSENEAFWVDLFTTTGKSFYEATIF